MIITERDEFLLRTLLFCARCMFFSQWRSFWPEGESGEKNSLRRARQLIAAGLLGEQRIFARPLLPSLSAPVHRWPEDGVPDIHAVAYKLQSRWKEPARRQLVFFATPKAARFLGGVGREKITQIYQVTHDCHVAEIYFLVAESDPNKTARFFGEDYLAVVDQGIAKKIDALVFDESGRPDVAVDFGGSYPAERVAKLHRSLQRLNIPYALW